MGLMFSQEIRDILDLAAEEACAHRGNAVSTEHLLLGLLRYRQEVGENGAVHLLETAFRVSRTDLRRRLKKAMGPKGDRFDPRLPIVFTGNAKQALHFALEETPGQEQLQATHLLLGLLRNGPGLAARTLHALGVEAGRCREVVLADQKRAEEA